MSFASIFETIKDAIKSLGIVFGDIGTSPIYTFSAIFLLIPVTLENVMGLASLIIWTLTFLVTGQYAWLAMSLGKERDGEGGIIVLKEILISMLTSKKAIAIVTFLSFIGTAFFIGDGVITPAISILSAVEGLKFIPGFEGISQTIVLIVAITITLLLFGFQRRGTERLSMAFGPIMLVWFIFLLVSGILSIKEYPIILRSFSPYYAFHFLFSNGIIGILLLSKVILCATGSEALYTDMGHLGKRPIIHAWLFVFPVLCLIYLGQGAFLLGHPQAHTVFHQMVLYQFKPFYIPLLLLSIIATIIASQAMITGLFSIVYQGIATQIFPRMHVEYTSRKLMTQIFIPTVNNFLLIFVLLTIIQFKSSQNLTDAYGIAVSGAMTITAILLTCIFILKKLIIKSTAAFILIFINMLFLISNLFKIPYGGYWSLSIACIPLGLIIIYTLGQQRLYKALKQLPFSFFIEKYAILAPKTPHLKGTALFLSKSSEFIATYAVNTIFTNAIIYENNIIVRVKIEKTAFGVTTMLHKELAPGLRIFEIRIGYLELVNIDKLLKAADIHPKAIFYGVEDIRTKNIIWKTYAVIKKLTPSFVQFYKFPPNKLHGVTVQVHI